MASPGRNTPMTRRRFFRACGRYGALAALVAGAALLTKRKTRTDDENCINRGLCSGCGKFARCGLPAALSAKKARGGPTP